MFLSDKDIQRQKKKKSPFNLSFSDLFPKPIEYQHQLIMQRLKPCPKTLTIIKGSLYKWPEASCNASLGSSRKWKNNVRREGRGEKRKKKISYSSRDIILSQYSKSPPLFSPKGMREYKTSITTCGIPRTIQNNSLAPL